MTFDEFETSFARHFEALTRTETHLYTVALDKDQLWETYLNAFPPGTNAIYRTRREFDCSCCRHFIKQFGNVVAILPDLTIRTLWDFDPHDAVYTPVVQAMANFVRHAAIQDVLVTREHAYGNAQTFDFGNDKAITWNHFYLKLPKSLIYRGTASPEEVKGEFRTSRATLERAFQIISPEAVNAVLEMIEEGVVYRGEEAIPTLKKFAKAQEVYWTLIPAAQNLFLWREIVHLPGSVTRLHNTAMGTLLANLTSGVPHDEALRQYETIMAPANYRRPQAKFTEKMVAQAKEKLASLGLLEALPRRFATPADLTINNVLWANRNAVKPSGSLDVFETLKDETQVDPRRFPANLPTFSIATFLEEVLPETTSLEILLEGQHEGNLASLLAPVNAEAPALFPWGNYAWAYNGNLADSGMKARVQAAGGKVDGVLRFSIQWNEGDDNKDDLDAHCKEPDGNEIFYRNLRNPRTLGNLDVDIVHPTSQPAVENITWPDLSRMPNGRYSLFVHKFSDRRGRNGFRAEIEFNGEVYAYDCRQSFSGNMQVATVTKDNRGFTIQHHLPPAQTTARLLWGLKTLRFHPVSTVILSPNHWDGRTHGNKHYFFMLAGCENPDQPNGFYNEFLLPELRPYRQVMEALSTKLKVAPASNQLSGLGFSSTLRNAVIAKVNGKLLKIVF